MNRTVLITGGSRGIGRAIAERFAAAGDSVYELSRSGEQQPQIRHIGCDISDPASIDDAFALLKKDGVTHIDVLVNNAGYGISGALEFTGYQQARAMFDADFFGAFYVTQRALPLLRQAAAPRVINISSVAAVFAIPFQGFYSAAKAAVNALTLAWRTELRPFGIELCAFMPGDVKSEFTAHRHKNNAGEELYGQRIAASLAVMERDEQNGMPPAAIAAAVYKLAGKRRLKPLYTCGFKYKLFLFLGKVLPTAAVTRIVAALYDKR